MNFKYDHGLTQFVIRCFYTAEFTASVCSVSVLILTLALTLEFLLYVDTLLNFYYYINTLRMFLSSIDVVADMYRNMFQGPRKSVF